jgi:hypothetical protein
MERGKIIESGRHQELLAEGGLYARLAATGFQEEKKPLLLEEPLSNTPESGTMMEREGGQS